MVTYVHYVMVMEVCFHNVIQYHNYVEVGYSLCLLIFLKTELDSIFSKNGIFFLWKTSFHQFYKHGCSRSEENVMLFFAKSST